MNEHNEYYDRLFKNQIQNGLHIDISIDDVCKEFEYYKSAPGNLSKAPARNKIVLYFQQENFYKKEIEQFSNDPVLRTKLIDNRVKYLFKPAEELTDFEILRGFKISKLGGNGYSHFSPLWTKYFAEKNKLHRVADPFGGWGHHMIGFAAADCDYVYNDLSHNTVLGVRRINDFFGMGNEIYEGNAVDFIIPEDCDGVFMCPPYYNIEEYECGGFASRDEYDMVMLQTFENWKNSNANILGIIIREDFESLLDFGLGDWSTKEVVNTAVSHFNKSGKKLEYLYEYHR